MAGKAGGFGCDSISPPRLLGVSKDLSSGYSGLPLAGKLRSAPRDPTGKLRIQEVEDAVAGEDRNHALGQSLVAGLDSTDHFLAKAQPAPPPCLRRLPPVRGQPLPLRESHAISAPALTPQEVQHAFPQRIRLHPRHSPRYLPGHRPNPAGLPSGQKRIHHRRIQRHRPGHGAFLRQSRRHRHRDRSPIRPPKSGAGDPGGRRGRASGFTPTQGGPGPARCHGAGQCRPRRSPAGVSFRRSPRYPDQQRRLPAKERSSTPRASVRTMCGPA